MKAAPTILAIETSTARGAVALLRGDQLLGEDSFDRPSPQQHLFGTVTRLLAGQNLSPRDLELFAVGLGPGSFAGIRVGIAAAKGLALPRARPVKGANSFDALALTALPHMPPDCQQLCVFADAKRGEICFALYDETGRRAGDCRLGTIESVADEIHDPIWFVSPEISTYRPLLAAAFGGFAVSAPTPLFPTAAAVGRLAYARFQADGQRGDDALEPVYLRMPQYKTIVPNPASPGQTV